MLYFKRKHQDFGRELNISSPNHTVGCANTGYKYTCPNPLLTVMVLLLIKVWPSQLLSTIYFSNAK